MRAKIIIVPYFDPINKTFLLCTHDQKSYYVLADSFFSSFFVHNLLLIVIDPVIFAISRERKNKHQVALLFYSLIPKLSLSCMSAEHDTPAG